MEGDDDDRDLHVSLLLQLGQHSCAEEDLALTDAVQVLVQVQVLHLRGGRSGSQLRLTAEKRREQTHQEVAHCNREHTPGQSDSQTMLNAIMARSLKSSECWQTVSCL